MPLANNHSVNIHYEVEGHGPPLALVHGFSGNRTSWRGYGFVDKLKDDYTLMLIDARGHGASDKPHQPEAYALPLLIDGIIAVLDDLHISKTHFMGYSMGGVIGFGLAKQYPDRLWSAIIGGASPYNRGDSNEPDFGLELYEQGLERGVEAIIEGMRAWAGSITPEYEERLRNADVRAGVAHLRWLHTNPPDFEANLPHITTACLLYAGAADEPTYAECQECVAQMPNASFLGLPGLNHVGAAGASDLLVPQIKRFLAAIP